MTAAELIQRLQQLPLEPTAEMLDAGAQRLVSWEDGSVWPDSWDGLQVAAARNYAERCWRSMWLAAPAQPQQAEPAHDCERRPFGDLRNAKWLDPECYAAGACQSLKFKTPQPQQAEPKEPT